MCPFQIHQRDISGYRATMTDRLPALPESWNRCLCVVAHPDDIEYGAASAVARWTAQGKTVTYLLATRGEAGIDAIPPQQAAPLRENEERAGAREVGVDVVEFLDYRDGVIEYSAALRKDIARAIRRHRPEVIVGGAFDVRGPMGMTNQADHRAVGLATLDAARDAGNRWIFPELADEGLEPWGGVKYVCLGGSGTPTHGVDITGEPLQRGIASLAAHAEYTKGLGAGFPEPGPMLTWAARHAGPALGVESAVLFDVHTLVFEGTAPWDDMNE
jgi:LmbE family N-acetylglucosaminyl deacetylase